MAASRKDLEGLPGWPRLLSSEQLAVYLSMAEGTVRRLIKDGTFPQPVISLPGCKRWDKAEIDKRLDMLSGLTAWDFEDDPAIRRLHEMDRDEAELLARLEDDEVLFGANSTKRRKRRS